MNDSYEKCFSLIILLLAGTSLWMIVFVELGLILVACEDNSINIKRKYWKVQSVDLIELTHKVD